jgi:hypothetical protein
MRYIINVMRVEINLSTVPPATELRDPDDLKSLKVVVRRADHAFIARDELLRLAGDRADDPAWRAEFEAMVGFAESQGWPGEDGSIRAHVATE